MDWRRRVCLLSSGLSNPVTAVLWLVRVEMKVRLLRVVTVMMVVMRIALNRGMICTTVAIVVRMWSPPYLALLRSSGRSFVLVGETMCLVSPLTCPLLLLVWKHSCTLIREVAVVALPTHVVMRVVAPSLAPNLSANWRWSLIGCPGAGAWLLDRPQSTLSHSVWRSVTPGSFGPFIFLHCLLLSKGGCQPSALSSTREYLWSPGKLGIHWGCTTVRVPWMLLLTVKGVGTRSS